MRGSGLGPQAYGENAGAGGILRRVALRDFVVRVRTFLERRAQFQRLATGAGMPAPNQDAEAWMHVRTTLDSTVARARSTGATCTLVLLPARVTDYDPPAYAARRDSLRTWAADRGVAFVDPAPAFAAVQARGGQPFLDDLHLSPEGQAPVAAAILTAWESP
jgi:hypothetical protein